LEIEKKLKELGFELPQTSNPSVGNFVGAVRTGNLVFVSGHVPSIPGGGFLHIGKVPTDVTIEQGSDSARQATLNCLASIKACIGNLDKVKRVVKLLCMVNCTPDFQESPRVANGASDLLVSLYGESGRHARSAVGMASLPNSVPFEIEMIIEVSD
jgi:enamine deaminase RidA (YjgF/YER057c/UK114 family)